MSSSATPLVGPVLALASWTFVIEAWLYAYRISDVTTYNVKITPLATKAEFDAQIPRHRRFPADNFTHLHEQPTVFYAVALASTFLELNDALTTGLAWGYVGVRVVHSLIQSTSNTPMVRFQLFASSSMLLLGMTLRAGWRWAF